MRKQELIHVHGLLAEVATQIPDDETVVDLEDYHRVEAAPTSIQLSKGDHKAAVFALTDAITSAVESEPVERLSAEPATAD